jgi:hypothetical protein
MTRIVVPEQRSDVQGIRFQFTEDKRGLFGKSVCLSSHEEGYHNLKPEYFESYRQLIEQIEGVKERALPEDKKMKLLETLEKRRGALHDRAASAIQQNLLSISWESVVMDHDAARKTFEVLFEAWDAPQRLGHLSYSEGALDGVDLREVEARVLEETGVVVRISSFTYGYHNNAPTNQYTIRFPDDEHPRKIPWVKRVIESYIPDRHPHQY